MTIYVVMYISIFIYRIFLAYLHHPHESPRKNIAIFCFGWIFIILALRHQSMGVDLGYNTSSGYLVSFNTISKMNWKSVLSLQNFLNYEKGYVIFNKLIGVILPECQFFLAVCAAISIGPIAYVIYKKSKMPTLSYFIYLGLPAFLLCYSGLRQAIAIAIVFMSIIFVQQKKRVKFVGTVLLATLFHSSAIIYLVVYPIYYLRLKKNAQFISVLFIPLVYTFRYSIFSIVSKIFRSNATPDSNSAITLFLIFTLIYIFTIFFGNDSEEVNGYRNIFYLACLCQAFGGVYSIAVRVTYYFMLSLVLLLPEILHRRTKNNIIFTILIGVAFISFGLYSLYVSQWSWAMASPWMPFWA